MPNWHKLTECMLKSTVALSYLYSFACLFVGCCHGMFLACWLRSFASAMHCDKQQPQLQPSQHYAHAIAQLCDLYLHTAMLLHALLAVEAQPLMDAATILGTTLWQMITCHSVVPKIVAVNSTRRSQFNLPPVNSTCRHSGKLNSILQIMSSWTHHLQNRTQLANVVAAIATPVAAQSPCNCTCSNFANIQS